MLIFRAILVRVSSIYLIIIIIICCFNVPILSLKKEKALKYVHTSGCVLLLESVHVDVCMCTRLLDVV